jgi:hypothetical protein
MAAAGTIVGSLGTWDARFGSSDPGTDSAGLYTLWLGGAGALALLASARGDRRDLCIIAALSGMLVLGIATYRLIDLLSESGPLGTDPVDPGWGVWVTAACGAGLAVCSVVLARGRATERVG